MLANSKPLAVLALLATMPDRTARRGRLAALLWPGVDARRARRSLRQALFHVSQKAGHQLIQATDASLQLDESALTVDLDEFESALRGARYERAVELYEGPFVPGLERKSGAELEHWIESQEEHVRAGLEVAYSRLVAKLLKAGAAARAAEYARRYVELNPFNERAQLALVRSLKAAGDRVGALQAYRSYRTLLREAVDGEPSEELEQAAAAIRRAAISEPEAPIQSAARVPLERPWRWAIGGALAGAAAIALAFVLGAPFLYPGLRGTAAAGPTAEISGQLYIWSRADGATEVLVARFADGALRLAPSQVRPGEIASPDGSRVATKIRARDGWNLGVRDMAGGEVRALTDAPDDERPRAWSPDGRRILYRKGLPLPGGRDYTNLLLAYDLNRDRVDTISTLRARGGYAAAWSPDGTRVAFLADPEGHAQLFVADSDGANPLAVDADPDEAARPAWSPDGQQLAFVASPFGSLDVFAVEPNGSAPRRLTDAPVDELAPIWLSPSVLVFTEVHDGRETLWALDVRTRERRPLVERPHMLRPQSFVPAEPVAGWLRDATISGLPGVSSPGENLMASLEIIDAADRPRDDDGLPVRWTTSDPRVASFTASRQLQVHRTGSVQVLASVGGWVADTVEIAVRRLLERPLPVAYREDWVQGLRAEEWVRFGTPLPYSRASGGRNGGGVLVSNGDDSFPSGVASRRAFDPRGGLTLEVWGRMPFTGKLYQGLSLLLVEDPPPQDGDERPNWKPVVALDIIGPSQQREASAFLVIDAGSSRIAAPQEPGAWHRYTLQLDADGTISYLVDGELRQRHPLGRPASELGELHIVLEGRSVDTEVTHGTVSLYAGAKYTLPHDADDG